MRYKTPLITILAGAILGYLALSPFAMYVSHVVHVQHPPQEMTITEVFDPVMWKWALLFVLFGGGIGLVTGLLLKKIENNVRESKRTREYIERLFNSTAEGIITIDKQFKIRRANSAYLEMMAAAPDEVIDRHCYEVSHKRKVPCLGAEHDCYLIEVFKSGISASAVHTHYDKEGNAIFVEVSWHPVRDETGSVFQAIEVIRDVSERKRMEQEIKDYAMNLEKMVEDRTGELKESQEALVRSERLAAIGKLSSAIGHKLRTPLGAITNSARFLRMALEEPPDKVEKHLRIIEGEVALSNEIITDMLEFARGKEPEMRAVELNGIVQQSLSSIKRPEDVEVSFELDPSLPPIKGDGLQLVRVFESLIRNAYGAMPGGGALSVSIRAVEDFEEVVFKDTGVGIDGENIQKVFEPLFSTKAKGVGLGLSICRMFVEKHGGTIEVRSEEGKGATFVVRLPT